MRTTSTVLALGAIASTALAQVSSTTCNGETYTYNTLAGYGYVPSDAYDDYSDTIGGIGSAIAIPRSSWKLSKKGVYTGTLYAIPDRGWNTQGTLNYQNRIHKFAITFTPNSGATVANPSSPNLHLNYQSTTLFTDPKGNPTTGLDADASGTISFKGFPDLPVATFTGNGFGGAGAGGQAVPIDSEGLVVLSDGSFWISDEYGPYLYKIGKNGKIQAAIQPQAAYLPMRNGSLSFSADSPTFYSGESDDVTPADPDTGRDNNHGFEGLTISTDEKTLYVFLQAALVQDGGLSSSTEANTRMLQYSIAGKTPVLQAEYVVPLPSYSTGKKNKTAASSEFHFVSPTQFLVLARDSNAGRGQSSSTSLYRHADVIDISNATNIHNQFDTFNATIAPGGVLNTTITPATYCPFLDYNINSQLNKFYLHNGGSQDNGLLNEKWESLALVPRTPGVNDGNYFLFSMSDNDFITQNGHLNGGAFNYSDASGFSLDSQVLIFDVTLPTGVAPGSK